VQLGEEKVYHERWYRGAVELTNKVEVLQAQLTEARNKTATLESELSIYVSNRAAVQAAIEKAEGEKREAEQKLAGETELVRKLNGDLSVADASIADMKAQMAEWKATAAAENTKLLRQREQAEVRVKELERELGRAKDETALVTVHLEKREELLNQLAWGRREETLLVENADLRREAREAKERAEKFEARAAAALGEREVMEAQLTEAKGLLSAAEAELEKYKREHASLNEQLDRAIDNGITDTEEEKARRLAAEARRDNRAHELGEAWRAELNRADKAEARAERLEGMYRSLVEASVRARKASDAVDRDPENADLDEFEDAYACLIIRENEALAAINPAATVAEEEVKG
jgi:chromosome segregation ATPase